MLANKKYILKESDIVNFDGIRVIGDIHGMFDMLEAALTQAKKDNMYVIQLGDIIDRGPYSPLCAELMLDLEKNKRGIFVIGNHEMSFAEFVLHGTKAAVTRHHTLMQFDSYGDDLKDQFVYRIRQGPAWILYNNYCFSHAGFHPGMISSNGRHEDQDMADFAISGRCTAIRRPLADDRSWVDTIPNGWTCLVGHVPTKSGNIELKDGKRGGKGIFLDTGSWRHDNEACKYFDIYNQQ